MSKDHGRECSRNPDSGPPARRTPDRSASSGRNGDRRELRAAGDIADRKNALDVGHLILVGDDVAVGIDLDPGRLATRCPRRPARGRRPRPRNRPASVVCPSRGDDSQGSVGGALQGLRPGWVTISTPASRSERIVDSPIMESKLFRIVCARAAPGWSSSPAPRRSRTARWRYSRCPPRRRARAAACSSKKPSEVMPSSTPGMSGSTGRPPVAMTMCLRGQRPLADDRRVCRSTESRPAANELDAALGQRALVDAVEPRDVGVALALQQGPVEAVAARDESRTRGHRAPRRQDRRHST